jgi:hypothetical protein
LSENSSASTTALHAKYWLGPYAIFVAILYLWGYWGTFNVNVLEHINISEVVKIAVYPLVSAFLFFVIGVLIGQFIAPGSSLPPGGGKNTALGRFLDKKIGKIFILFLFVGVCAFIFFDFIGSREKWTILAIVVAFVIYLPLKSSDVLRNELKSDEVRSAAIFIVSALVPFAYVRGAMNAQDILTGKNFLYQNIDPPSVQDDSAAEPSARLRYLGKLNDRFIFFDPVKEATVFVAMAEVKALELKRHKESPGMAALKNDSDSRSRAAAPVQVPAVPSTPGQQAPAPLR